jgi:acetylornithine deacetylase/succinyl-diaminopimelate desuccinylase-like protein
MRSHPSLGATPLSFASAVLGTLLLAAPLSAQSTGDAARLREQVRRWRTANDVGVLGELRALLAMPNLASDSAGIRTNARAIVAMLEKRGVRAELLEAPGTPPAVFGELRVPGATRTVVLYAHYDGQPVDSARWASAPWTPVLRDGVLGAGGKDIPFPTRPGTVQGEWRLYARSASDDKGPIVVMLAALDALKAAGRRPAVNVKFFLEGEEEAGSAHLADMLARHREKLAADLWLFADGPVHQSRRFQVVYGVRGVSDLELTVYGPLRPLHSGHYGNFAPNPIVLLSELVTSLRAADGRIMVDGLLDHVPPPTAAELRAIAAVPAVDSALRHELGVAQPWGGGRPYLEALLAPSINLRGVSAGGVGAGGSNTISTEARASIDFRLVPRLTPELVREHVERHLRARGWHVTHAEPTPGERRAHARIVRLEWGTGGYPAVRASMDAPASRALVRAVNGALAQTALEVPTLGGSLPLHVFEQVLGAPVIVLPVVNHDNNQHGHNENVRLQNLWDGIELYAGVLAGLRW